MTEALLQFIWRYQLLIPNSLQLIDGTLVHLKYPANGTPKVAQIFWKLQLNTTAWSGMVPLKCT